MKEHPILFSGEMVRAILDGRKTQTRRVAKFAHGAFWDHGGWKPEVWVNGINWKTIDGNNEHLMPVRCPYGFIGDRLWVREKFRLGQGRKILYFDSDSRWAEGQGWKPSIHMPRAASRITLEIVSVRVERVQDISEEDARAEGVAPLFYPDDVKRRPELYQEPMPFFNYLWHGNHEAPRTLVDSWEHQFSSYASARDSYSSLWHLINAKRGYGWNKNPWVWVIEFKRVW